MLFTLCYLCVRVWECDIPNRNTHTHKYSPQRVDHFNIEVVSKGTTPAPPGPANNFYFNLIKHPKRRLFKAVQHLVQQMLWLLYNRIQRPTLSGNLVCLTQLLSSSSHRNKTQTYCKTISNSKWFSILLLVDTMLHIWHQGTFTVFLLSSFFHYKPVLISCTAGNNTAFESHRVQP